MAVFNPNPQEVGLQDWSGVSKSISQPQPNEALSTLIKGVSNVMDETVTASNFIVKKGIQDEATKRAEGIQTDYTAELQRTAAALKPSQPTTDSNGNPIQQPLDLMSTGADTSVLPTDIQTLPQSLSTLTSAKANNKVSETYYYGRLDSLAKELRARYPGYRDFVDSEIEKATGVKPANALVKSLIGDINASAAALKGSQDKALSEALKFIGYPGSEKIIPQVQSGQLGMAGVVAWAAPYKQQETKWEWQTKGFAALNEEDKYKSIRAGQAMSTDIPATISNWMNSWTIANKLDGHDNMMEVFNLARQGKLDVSDEQAQGLVTDIRGAKSKMISDLWAKYNKPTLDENGKPGPSFAAAHGLDATRKLIEEGTKGMDDLAEYVGNKEWGLATMHARKYASQGQDDLFGLSHNSDVDVQTFTRWSRAINSLGSPQQQEKLFQYLFAQHYDEKFNNWIQGDKLKIMVQPNDPNRAPVPGADVNPAANPSGKPFTATERINSYTEGLKKTGENPDPKIIKTIVEDPVKIINGDFPEPAKKNAATYAFHPSNLGLVDNIKGSKDKFDAYNTLVSERMTLEMKKLDHQYPGTFAQYSEWAKATLGVKLIPRELGELDKLVDNPNMKITWNSKSLQFNVIPQSIDERPAKDNQYNAMGIEIGIRHANEVLYRINSGIKSYANVAKANGEDPEAFVLQAISQLGGNFGRVEGIPAKLQKAMISSRPPEEPKQ